MGVQRGDLAEEQYLATFRHNIEEVGNNIWQYLGQYRGQHIQAAAAYLGYLERHGGGGSLLLLLPHLRTIYVQKLNHWKNQIFQLMSLLTK